MTFHDWMKNMSAKEREEIDRLACKAEDARERAEELEWEDYSEDRTGWEYEFFTEFDK